MGRSNARGIIEYSGKYLLVRQRSSDDGVFWCLPGGGIEDGEDIISTLEREFIEELGVRPTVGNLLFAHQIKDRDGYSGVGFYFHVTNGEDYVNLDIPSTSHGKLELLEAKFVDIEQVHALPDFLKTELPKLASQGFTAPTRIMLTENEE